MKNDKKIIGVLGGLGPQPTGQFYLDLMTKFAKRFNISSNTDYPHLIINSIPAKELIYGADKNTIEEYVNGLKTLEKLKVDTIAIICNTAYLYLNSFKRKIKTPIINLKKELGKFLKENNIKTMTIFGSKATLQKGLYNYKGIKNINLTKQEITKLSSAIEKLNLEKEKNKQVNFIKSLYKKYYKKSDLIIIGCTETALILKDNKNTIDTMDLLTERIINEYVNCFFTKKKSKIHGYGIFTNRNIEKGKIFYRPSTLSIVKKPHHRYAKINKDEYLNEVILNWVNHSCMPNTKLNISKGDISLIALKNIKSGEEITCNYDATEIGGVKVKCNCETKKCQKYFKRVE